MLKFVSLNRIRGYNHRCAIMSEEPSITTQLNSIIEYLNYHGHLFLRVDSNRHFDEIEEEGNLFKTWEICNQSI